MLRQILFLVCLAVTVMAYPTDSPISESPIVLASPDNLENSISSLDLAEAAQDDDCEVDLEPSSFRTKGAVDQEQSSQARRCLNQNFIRFIRESFDSGSELESPGNKDTNFIRFGRGGKGNDNFIRFGRASKQSNFIRLGRDKSDNFIRFGRGKTDNFIRFGRGKTDNFVRFGRGKSNNFVRFGRGKPENFIRFGRGKQDNFIRFGRGMKDNFVRFGRGDISNLEDQTTDYEDDFPNDSSNRVTRAGKDSNFIRFGRAKGSNFIRLGRGNDDDLQQREERSKANNFVRFGRNLFDDDELVRYTRSGSGNLRRGKLTDRNFIRLGRSGEQYESSSGDDRDDNSERSGRSSSRNFIRLGKRAEENDPLLRIGRDVEQIDEMPVLSSTESNQNDKENKTDDYEHSRKKRSLPYPAHEDTAEDSSSDYPVIISNSAYEEDKVPVDDIKPQLGYYSPLTSGIPNYILGPELAVLAPLSNGAETSMSKRAKGRDHNRNYIRLG